ncbi:group III truncated hemoglobin [Pararhizobium haloflavum]|uniref:group III truncated hemoglobin n=1 Tax=Pararhizobium haloflavum TaxID=2037914 RepID=UPI000C18A26F|nr:group III truncated hemoglobin [Pararhizobium haloflavum]
MRLSDRPRPKQELPPDHPGLDRVFIGGLVREFYSRVRTNDRLGPIFSNVIGEAWEPHLEKMTDFWCAVILKNGAYSGRPVPAHLKLDQVREEDFDIWLSIFRRTVSDLCDPKLAAIFMERAELIAKSLKLAMFFRLPATASPSKDG